MSVAVVRSLGLSMNEVVFLYYRNYKAPNCEMEFSNLDISNCPNFPHPLTVRSILKSSQLIKLIDSTICKVCNNDNYIVYISTMSTLLSQVFVTNSLCLGYHFIEEGIANYRNNLYREPATKRSKVVTMMCSIFNLFHRRISLNYPFLKPFDKYFRKNYVPKYFLLDNKFHAAENISNVVLLPFYKDRDVNHKYDYSNSKMFIMSPLLEYRLCSLENLRYVLCNFFSQLKGGEPLFVKYHPQQNTQTKELIASIALRYNVVLKEVDMSIPMEQVLLYSNNSRWYGFESSLLFYASLLNQSVQSFSLSAILEEQDSQYAAWLRTLPSIILEASIRLKKDTSA